MEKAAEEVYTGQKEKVIAHDRRVGCKKDRERSRSNDHMLHAILGLILLIFVIFSQSARRALRGPARRRRSQIAPRAGLDVRAEPSQPIAPAPLPNTDGAEFVPSFKPFKPERKNGEGVEKRQQEEWEEFGSVLTKDTYPHGYGSERDAKGELTFRFKEKFRSQVEVEWARGFDQLALQWEYEPLKFDMGPEHFSYCPDFKITGLSVPDSNRPLYIEVKWFGEEMNLTKYVRFTEWYQCDLLMLAHYDRHAWQRASRRARGRPSVLKRNKQRFYLVLRCMNCDRYIGVPCDDRPADDDEPRNLAELWRYESCVCRERPIERLVVPDDFLIQAGVIGTGSIPDRISEALRIS